MATKLLTEHDVSDQLKVSTKTLQRWRHTGIGPRFVKIAGTTIRYPEPDVENFIQSNMEAQR